LSDNVKPWVMFH